MTPYYGRFCSFHQKAINHQICLCYDPMEYQSFTPLLTLFTLYLTIMFNKILQILADFIVESSHPDTDKAPAQTYELDRCGQI